ncbi:Calmodulin [Hondaea fermentalgiana]|uniref:Calmodulin n=1 Tax=Hondaea fermentalgiana TaxID=2315210 RepID=A0A2R5GHG0_9STRA|nr:Calmodulin [Hondaea fermentalgiana]|eukprot:GBG29158.1 Calmodulin [Hondaea fermentalgiana]
MQHEQALLGPAARREALRKRLHRKEQQAKARFSVTSRPPPDRVPHAHDDGELQRDSDDNDHASGTYEDNIDGPAVEPGDVAAELNARVIEGARESVQRALERERRDEEYHEEKALRVERNAELSRLAIESEGVQFVKEIHEGRVLFHGTGIPGKDALHNQMENADAEVDLLVDSHQEWALRSPELQEGLEALTPRSRQLRRDRDSELDATMLVAQGRIEKKRNFLLRVQRADREANEAHDEAEKIAAEAQELLEKLRKQHNVLSFEARAKTRRVMLAKQAEASALRKTADAAKEDAKQLKRHMIERGLAPDSFVSAATNAQTSPNLAKTKLPALAADSRAPHTEVGHLTEHGASQADDPDPPSTPDPQDWDYHLREGLKMSHLELMDSSTPASSETAVDAGLEMGVLDAIASREQLIASARSEAEACSRKFQSHLSGFVQTEDVGSLLYLLNRLRVASVRVVEALVKWRRGGETRLSAAEGAAETFAESFLKPRGWVVKIGFMGEQLYPGSKAFRSKVKRFSRDEDVNGKKALRFRYVGIYETREQALRAYEDEIKRLMAKEMCGPENFPKPKTIIRACGKHFAVESEMGVPNTRCEICFANSFNHFGKYSPSYMWNGQNYLLKMLHDTNFLEDIELLRLFFKEEFATGKLSFRGNPFLLAADIQNGERRELRVRKVRSESALAGDTTTKQAAATFGVPTDAVVVHPNQCIEWHGHMSRGPQIAVGKQRAYISLHVTSRHLVDEFARKYEAKHFEVVDMRRIRAAQAVLSEEKDLARYMYESRLDAKAKATQLLLAAEKQARREERARRRENGEEVESSSENDSSEESSSGEDNTQFLGKGPAAVGKKHGSSRKKKPIVYRAYKTPDVLSKEEIADLSNGAARRRRAPRYNPQTQAERLSESRLHTAYFWERGEYIAVQQVRHDLWGKKPGVWATGDPGTTFEGMQVRGEHRKHFDFNRKLKEQGKALVARRKRIQRRLAKSLRRGDACNPETIMQLVQLGREAQGSLLLMDCDTAELFLQKWQQRTRAAGIIQRNLRAAFARAFCTDLRVQIAANAELELRRGRNAVKLARRFTRKVVRKSVHRAKQRMKRPFLTEAVEYEGETVLVSIHDAHKLDRFTRSKATLLEPCFACRGLTTRTRERRDLAWLSVRGEPCVPGNVESSRVAQENLMWREKAHVQASEHLHNAHATMLAAQVHKHAMVQACDTALNFSKRQIELYEDLSLSTNQQAWDPLENANNAIYIQRKWQATKASFRAIIQVFELDAPSHPRVPALPPSWVRSKFTHSQGIEGFDPHVALAGPIFGGPQHKPTVEEAMCMLVRDRSAWDNSLAHQWSISFDVEDAIVQPPYVGTIRVSVYDASAGRATEWELDPIDLRLLLLEPHAGLPGAPIPEVFSYAHVQRLLLASRDANGMLTHQSMRKAIDALRRKVVGRLVQLVHLNVIDGGLRLGKLYFQRLRRKLFNSLFPTQWWKDLCRGRSSLQGHMILGGTHMIAGAPASVTVFENQGDLTVRVCWSRARVLADGRRIKRCRTTLHDESIRLMFQESGDLESFVLWKQCVKCNTYPRQVIEEILRNLTLDGAVRRGLCESGNEQRHASLDGKPLRTRFPFLPLGDARDASYRDPLKLVTNTRALYELVHREVLFISGLHLVVSGRMRTDGDILIEAAKFDQTVLSIRLSKPRVRDLVEKAGLAHLLERQRAKELFATLFALLAVRTATRPPHATREHPFFAKFCKMLQVGVPRGAVAHAILHDKDLKASVVDTMHVVLDADHSMQPPDRFRLGPRSYQCLILSQARPDEHFRLLHRGVTCVRGNVSVSMDVLERNRNLWLRMRRETQREKDTRVCCTEQAAMALEDDLAKTAQEQTTLYLEENAHVMVQAPHMDKIYEERTRAEFALPIEGPSMPASNTKMIVADESLTNSDEGMIETTAENEDAALIRRSSLKSSSSIDAGIEVFAQSDAHAKTESEVQEAARYASQEGQFDVAKDDWKMERELLARYTAAAARTSSGDTIMRELLDPSARVGLGPVTGGATPESDPDAETLVKHSVTLPADMLDILACTKRSDVPFLAHAEAESASEMQRLVTWLAFDRDADAHAIRAYLACESWRLTPIERAFRRFDSNRDGGLDPSEFRALAFSIGHVLTAEEATEALSLIDKDGNGTISLRELSLWALCAAPSKEKDLKFRRLQFELRVAASRARVRSVAERARTTVAGIAALSAPREPGVAESTVSHKEKK